SAESAYQSPPGPDPDSVPAAGNVTQITLDYTSRTKPPVRRGWWVLDATMGYFSGSNFTPSPQGFFYPVVNVNDDTPGRLRLELQTPLRPLSSVPVAPNPRRVFVIMDNVVEVFDKGTIDPKEEIRPF